MRVIRIFLIIISILFFVWFALPLSLSVSLNLGNVTGLGLSVLLLLYSIWMPMVHRWIAAWRIHRIMKWFWRGSLVIMGIILGLVILESACMIRAACRKPAKEATVVVLGCRVYGQRASLSMVERLEAAYEYLTENEDAVCILSGGQGPGEDITEAECMYRWLVNKGIDPQRLYKEEESASTRENLAFSKRLIEAEGLNPAIAITTSEYHQYRAGRIAKGLDMEYGAIPGWTAIWLFPTYYVRELYGILYEWIM